MSITNKTTFYDKLFLICHFTVFQIRFIGRVPTRHLKGSNWGQFHRMSKHLSKYFTQFVWSGLELCHVFDPQPDCYLEHWMNTLFMTGYKTCRGKNYEVTKNDNWCSVCFCAENVELHNYYTPALSLKV